MVSCAVGTPSCRWYHSSTWLTSFTCTVRNTLVSCAPIAEREAPTGPFECSDTTGNRLWSPSSSHTSTVPDLQIAYATSMPHVKPVPLSAATAPDVLSWFRCDMTALVLLAVGAELDGASGGTLLSASG
jgi:hypothetical protein